MSLSCPPVGEHGGQPRPQTSSLPAHTTPGGEETKVAFLNLN